MVASATAEPVTRPDRSHASEPSPPVVGGPHPAPNATHSGQGTAYPGQTCDRTAGPARRTVQGRFIRR